MSSGVDGNYVIDGFYDITFDNASQNSYTATFDYTATYQGETYSTSGTYNCNFETAVGCTYTSNFSDREGRSYRAENVSVSGNASQGYNVNARVYSETHGYIDIRSSGLVPCDGGGFSSGEISVTDASGAAVVTATFSGCNDDYIVTYQGTTFVVAQ
jgi:hypothetical protein